MRFFPFSVVLVLVSPVFAYYEVSSSTDLQRRLENLAYIHYGTCEAEKLFNIVQPPSNFSFRMDKVKLKAFMYIHFGKRIGLGQQTIQQILPDQNTTTDGYVMYDMENQTFECSAKPLNGTWGFKDNVNDEKQEDLESELGTGISLEHLEVKVHDLALKVDDASSASGANVPWTGVLLVGQKQLMELSSTQHRCDIWTGHLTSLVEIAGMIVDQAEFSLLYYDGEHYYKDSDCMEIVKTSVKFRGYEPRGYEFDFTVRFVDMKEAKSYLREIAGKYRSECVEGECEVVTRFEEQPQLGMAPEESIKTLCNGKELAVAVRTQVLTTGTHPLDRTIEYGTLVYFDKDGVLADTSGRKTFLAVNFDSVGI